MAYSKEDLAREFELPIDEVQEILKACGISVRKRSYDENERARFQEARELLADGSVSSYDEIEEYFRDSEGESLGDVPASSLEDALRQQAIAQGLELGVERAEIIRQVLPQATMMRLQQLIAQGELQRDMEEFWSRAFPKKGKRPVTMDEIEAQWTSYELSESPMRMPLPPSSTESSESE